MLESPGQAIAREYLPRLMALRAQMRSDGREPDGVVLPSHLDPGPYVGDGATDPATNPARLMGLPVTWGDGVGLIFRA